MLNKQRRLSGLLAVMAILLLTSHAATAQQNSKADGTVKGKVIHRDDSTPLAYVIVMTEDGQSGTTTDLQGRFTLKNLKGTAVRLSAHRVGLKKKLIEVVLQSGEARNLTIEMEDDAVLTEQIVVTSKESNRSLEPGTVSTISSKAIEHLQASSLGDVLQLVPGQVAQNPSLSGPQQSLLRQIPTGTDGSYANALGTALIVDGVPLSNNANLQSTVNNLGSSAGLSTPFTSVAGRGLDLRQIQTNNIESVEVIRGVPSAKYGDLSTGAIIVNTRAGEYPTSFKLKVNPVSYEANLGAGWKLSDLSFLSFDANYTKEQDDPRQTLDSYSRYTGQIAWSRYWNEQKTISSDLRLALFYTADETQMNPEDTRQQKEVWSKDKGMRFSSTFEYYPYSDRTAKLEWKFSSSYTKQDAYYQELVNRDIFPITSALTDTTLVATYGASEYLSRLYVKGNPLNFYSRLEGSVRYDFLGIGSKIIAGMEWKNESNSGDGRQFDPSRPPRLNYSVGDRPRTFDEVPALNLLSFYLEERGLAKVFGRDLIMQLGVRFDNLNPQSLGEGEFGTVLAPRINTSFQVLNGFWIFGGYGVTAKIPTLLYLYPGTKYYDLVNFNYYAANPAERLTIVTTRTFNPSNGSFHAYKNHKKEAGVELKTPFFSGTVTVFKENTNGGFGISRIPTVLPYPVYKIAQTRPGQTPILDPVPARIDTFVGAYDVPMNTRNIENTGVEMSADIPEIKAINTSFNITGAWIKTRSTDDAMYVDTDALFRSANAPARLGVYPSGSGSEAQRFSTSVRAIYQLPELRLIISLLAQTIWIDRDVPVGLYSLPAGYMDKTGKITYISKEEASSPRYADLVRPYPANYYLEEDRPPLWLFNLRLTKEFPFGMQVSFFVNNILSSRPLYMSKRSNAYQRRNQKLFFGTEISYKIL